LVLQICRQRYEKKEGATRRIQGKKPEDGGSIWEEIWACPSVKVNTKRNKGPRGGGIENSQDEGFSERERKHPKKVQNNI